MNALLESALWYREKMGFCVIPVRPDFDPIEGKFFKKPYIKWAEFQKRLSTEAEIRSWWTKWPAAMIGVITGELCNLYIIDCDSDEAYQKIQSLLPDSFLTPIVLTPRGGHHLWFKCSNGGLLRSVPGVLPETDTRGNGGYIIAPPSINEHGGTYQWAEGLDLGSVAPQELPQDIVSTFGGGSGGDGGRSIDGFVNTTHDDNDYIILHKGHRDQDLFSIGMALADGRYKRSNIVQVLNILAKNCNPPFPENELSDKIKSVFSRITIKDRNLMDEVREWCLLQKGSFNTSDIRHDLHITTKIEIKNLSVIVNRLEDKGIIEKYGEKRGYYRTKDEFDKLEMRFIEEFVPEFDIKLPFGLGGIVSLYPKNIIIVAGSKSAGKTALLLRIAVDNQKINEVVYLNSEMGDEEWSVRLKKIGLHRKEDIGFKALGIHQNFHDVMDGSKKIYIVDYLEIHESFFEIAKPIRKIHETLKDGICIIAVQKKKGEIYARGGEFSAEKSRLYLSLDYLEDQRCTQMTIVDVKSPKLPENPRGWGKRIKIIDGSKMESLDKDWVF